MTSPNSRTRSTNTHQQRKRRRRVLSSAVAVLFLQNPASGFSVTSNALRTQQSSSSSWQRYFRSTSHEEETVASNFCPPSAPASSYGQVQQQQSFTQQHYPSNLPTWLSIPNSHLAEHNVELLHTAMKASFFTESETLQLIYAIDEASCGDPSLVAGSAEFCQIMVETMEMGLNALVAGVFHYCACRRARHYNSASIDVPHAALERYGSHALGIVQDAARLKHLEMVASKVMQNDTGRVRPDSKDAENLRKLLLLETHDWRGLAIRAAASLYRLKGIQAAGGLLSRENMRCAREALSIYAPLASRMGMHRLKNELEGAAFCLLYPRQYQRVSSENDQATHATRKVLLDQVSNEMTAMLEQDTEFRSLVENFSVTARVKEPYSMWKKMLLRRYSDIRQVPDSIALRIVLEAKKLTHDEPEEVTRARERALCYYAQKLCTHRWKPLEGNPRFKDYIESPKANGYQSLHYTAQTSFDGEDWTLEIQVRSGEMHQVAEFGLASHWDYKEQQQQQMQEQHQQSSDAVPTFSEASLTSAGEYAEASSFSPGTNSVSFDRSSDAYVRKVQEWHWQQHVAAAPQGWDASPASFEPVTRSDIWQSKVRADRINARTQRLEPYLAALTTAQSELARESIFIFVTQSEQENAADGKVLALPSGACVLDALREGEKTMGFPLYAIDQDALVLNGGSTSVTRQLQNGDVLTLPLSRTPTMVM